MKFISILQGSKTKLRDIELVAHVCIATKGKPDFSLELGKPDFSPDTDTFNSNSKVLGFT